MSAMGLFDSANATTTPRTNHTGPRNPTDHWKLQGPLPFFPKLQRLIATNLAGSQ